MFARTPLKGICTFSVFLEYTLGIKNLENIFQSPFGFLHLIFHNEKIPTLQQLLQLLNGKGFSLGHSTLLICK